MNLPWAARRLLGEVPDALVSDLTGVPYRQVKRQRHLAGIESSGRARKTIALDRAVSEAVSVRNMSIGELVVALKVEGARPDRMVRRSLNRIGAERRGDCWRLKEVSSGR